MMKSNVAVPDPHIRPRVGRRRNARIAYGLMCAVTAMTTLRMGGTSAFTLPASSSHSKMRPSSYRTGGSRLRALPPINEPRAFSSRIIKTNRSPPLITPSSLHPSLKYHPTKLLAKKKSEEEAEEKSGSDSPLGTLKDSLITLLDRITSFFEKLKIPIFSFLGGVIVTLCLVLIPIFSTIDKLEQPVTLFETILADLDRGYVDPVDTKKLFQTGVSAMLRSLDPYTEYYEANNDIQESVSGRYGGVGLVISGKTGKQMSGDEDADGVVKDEGLFQDTEDDEGNAVVVEKKPKKRVNQEIRVVSAFEGYAFDFGMRVGDRLLAVDQKPIAAGSSVEDVRNMLRGTPGSDVVVNFERDGVKGVQTATIPRRVVKIRDVKCYAMLQDNVGYVQLSGFSPDAGKEVRAAIMNLQGQSLETNNGQGLRGIVLDLRNNPGGLLTSAVDVASLFVPKNADIVSARGRGFPGVLYRSRSGPLLPPGTKLAVLTNGGTASAAEIVSGAIQDLDAGVIVGEGRTYGKGLVQNVEELPFDTALKYTVAKYYTPSGRCIQAVNYKEGGGLQKSEEGFTSSKVESQGTFYTRGGRLVKDGGGIEADFKVKPPKASALEVTLLRSNIFLDFAADWSKTNEFSDKFQVDDDLYKDFIAFVQSKSKSGDIKLSAIYKPSLDSLHAVLKQSGYKGSDHEVDNLQEIILREINQDFTKYKKDIKEDISNSILARYLPESMLIERTVKSEDVQVAAAIKLIKDTRKYDQLLARAPSPGTVQKGSNLETASITQSDENAGFKVNVKW